jgi:hypothetical protein
MIIILYIIHADGNIIIFNNNPIHHTQTHIHTDNLDPNPQDPRPKGLGLDPNPY